MRFMRWEWAKALASWSSRRSPTPRRRTWTPAVEPLEDRTLFAAAFPEFIAPHPAPGNGFGASVVPLSTGNVVITSPYDDDGGIDARAVYLFNGITGALISTLTGSSPNDWIGDRGVTALPSGYFVVSSPMWDNGAAMDAGAVTWGSPAQGSAVSEECLHDVEAERPHVSHSADRVMGYASSR